MNKYRVLDTEFTNLRKAKEAARFALLFHDDDFVTVFRIAADPIAEGYYTAPVAMATKNHRTNKISLRTCQ